MCLVILAWHLHPEVPLIVAANRDELFARPAEPVHELEPHIVGGRDVLAGGTWLATNASGVVAAITNQPLATRDKTKPQGSRDPSKHSRGELPLALARYSTAADAVRAFARERSPRDYNPCALLVADRDSAFYIGMQEGDVPFVRELAAGLHILENRPLDAPSPKADHARAAVQKLTSWPTHMLVEHLGAVLANAEIPASAVAQHAATADPRPIEVEAACVSLGAYGTRSSTVVLVDTSITVYSTNAPPMTAPFVATRVS